MTLPNIDADLHNADWLKTSTWDMPTTLDGFLRALGIEHASFTRQLEDVRVFAETHPAWEALPEGLGVALEEAGLMPDEERAEPHPDAKPAPETNETSHGEGTGRTLGYFPSHPDGTITGEVVTTVDEDYGETNVFIRSRQGHLIPVIPAEVSKHPGHPDQKVHGRRKGAKKTPTKKPKPKHNPNDPAKQPKGKAPQKKHKKPKRAGGDKRGNSYARRARKHWMLREWGDGTSCPCVHCSATCVFDTVESDRIDPDGPYRRENVQPSCRTCNLRRSDDVEWEIEGGTNKGLLATNTPGLYMTQAGEEVWKHGGPGPHKNGSPQSIHGTKRGKRLGAALRRDGGYTYRVIGNRHPTTGYVVSVFPEHERIHEGEATAGQVNKYLQDKWEFCAEKDERYYGGWSEHEKEDDDTSPVVRTWLDIVKVFEDKDEAHAAAIEFEQEGYWDVEAKTTIYTRAAGARAEENVVKRTFFWLG